MFVLNIYLSMVVVAIAKNTANIEIYVLKLFNTFAALDSKQTDVLRGWLPGPNK